MHITTVHHRWRLAALAPIALAALLAVSTLDGMTRSDGYRPLRHWMSLLALGQRAQLGTAAMAISGMLVVAGAVGFFQLLRGQRGGRTTAAVLAVLGVSLVGAAIFPVDPVTGYPSGATAPSSPSLDARLHALFGGLLFLTWCATGFAGIRWSGERPGLRRLARCCGCAALASVVTCAVLVAATGGRRWDAAYAGAFQRAALLATVVWLIALTVVTAPRSGETEVIDLTTRDELHGGVEARGVDGAGHQDELVDARCLGVVEREQ